MEPHLQLDAPSRLLPLLGEIHSPPTSLFYRGDLTCLAQAPCVAIVGTRRASPYGLHMAWKLAAELAVQGVTVVSGLALGIDGAAHRGALHAGGKTVAVLGSDVQNIYPREHAGLATRIVQASGAVLSEYSVGTRINAWHFPQRNRLVAGLCVGVVVVEAPVKSGALITAELALQQNRDVFAVPGPAHAESFGGNHLLIQQGAKLITSAADVLNEVSQTMVNARDEGHASAGRLEKLFLAEGGNLSLEQAKRWAEGRAPWLWEEWAQAESSGRIVEIAPQHYAWMPHCK